MPRDRHLKWGTHVVGNSMYCLTFFFLIVLLCLCGCGHTTSHRARHVTGGITYGRCVMFGHSDQSSTITSFVHTTTCILCSLHYCIVIQVRLQYTFPLFTSAFIYCPLLCQILLL